jgi:hypothetical protein
MTALWGAENVWLGVQKHGKIEKVTGSPNDIVMEVRCWTEGALPGDCLSDWFENDWLVRTRLGVRGS